MNGASRSWNTDAATRIPALRLTEYSLPSQKSPFRVERSAITLTEPEDAQLTGMTRSLDRRLLALNLKPSASVGLPAVSQIPKVA